MAIVQNPIIGRTRNQAGGMVFSTIYGQNVMRARPASYNDAKSQAQVDQRTKMAFLATIVATVKSFLSKIILVKPTGMPAYSKLVKILSSLVTCSEGVISMPGYPATMIPGVVPGFVNASAKWEAGQFQFEADSSESTYPINDDAYVRGLIINITAKSAKFVEGQLSSGQLTINMGVIAGWSENDDLRIIGWASNSGDWSDVSDFHMNLRNDI